MHADEFRRLTRGKSVATTATMKKSRTALNPLKQCYDYVVGIDPDIHKNGLSRLNTATRSIELAAMPFAELIDYVKHCHSMAERVGKTLVVVVEAGWLTAKSCFHSAQGKGAEKIAKDVGANHQVGRLIIEMVATTRLMLLSRSRTQSVGRARTRRSPTTSSPPLLIFPAEPIKRHAMRYFLRGTMQGFRLLLNLKNR